MHKSIERFFHDERAATSVEYGLIAGLIAIVIIAMVTQTGTRLRTKFGAVSNNLT